MTPDVKECVDRCPVHGATRESGICVSAVNLFGRTLGRIADLNGIPRDAPSWRHGSIQSRCQLLERFAGDANAVQRFDRTIFYIKVTMLALTAVGTVIAVILYYEPVMKGMGWR